MPLDADKQRQFATDVVRELREHGYQALWAGGCVRDRLLGQPPKDYDVATSARPEEIQKVFGRRRTLAIGAAFGVITVLGPKDAGQIEVATFRQDVSYSDGRRPNDVRFSSPEEDARRRDFTINGIFFDPLTNEVIDYVGGQADLQARMIRAIGDAQERFTEDKLRMLRAVRFAATLDFELEAETAAAIRAMARQITIVSAERIAAEMRLMLERPGRVRAVELLEATDLLPVILPELSGSAPATAGRSSALAAGTAVLGALDKPAFPLALAALLHAVSQPDVADRVGERWKLSNDETERVDWLHKHQRSLVGARTAPWSQIQPLLAHDDGADLVALGDALARVGAVDAADIAVCRQKLGLPRPELDPPPLITGEDLIELGIPRGPVYAKLLQAVRRAQLDGEVESRADALTLVRVAWHGDRDSSAAP